MSAARCWLAPVSSARAAAGADAFAPTEGGSGGLAAWFSDDPPHGVDARAVDARLIGAAGGAAWVSLVWPVRGAFVLFDDVAVQGARRAILSDAEPADAVSSLLVDDRHFAGAVTIRRGRDAATRLRDDPFGRVDRNAARIVRVGAGLFGTSAPPPGPVIERHGSAVPWPGGRFQ